jgi:hypothetical protein
MLGKNEGDEVSVHVEYELKLQDLNRYYATFTGSPIMMPLDAIRALAMFGHVANKQVVSAILARHGIGATDAQITAALTAPKVRRDGKADTFRLAYRLVDGFSALGVNPDNCGEGVVPGDPESWDVYRVEDGLNQKDHAAYEKMLEQIIIEAPGHI